MDNLDVKFLDSIIIPFKMNSKRKVDEAFEDIKVKSGKSDLSRDVKRKTTEVAAVGLEAYEYHDEVETDLQGEIFEIADLEREDFFEVKKMLEESNDSLDVETEYQDLDKILQGNREIPLPDYNFKVLIEEKTPDDFMDCVFFSLEQINSKPVGQRLIQKLDNSFCNITIKYDSEDSVQFFREQQKVVISFQAAVDFSCGMDGKRLVDWPFISLAHELIHAYHFLYGKDKTFLPCSNKLIWTDQEEYTTKMGSLDSPERIRPKISENAIRQEHDLPLTFGHHDEGWMNNQIYRKGFFTEVEKFLSMVNKN